MSRISGIGRYVFKDLWPHAVWHVAGATLITSAVSAVQLVRANLDVVAILYMFVVSFLALVLKSQVSSDGDPPKSQTRWIWFVAFAIASGLGLYLVKKLPPRQNAVSAGVPTICPPAPLPEVFNETHLIGDWQWHYPRDGWEGTVTFSRVTTGIAFAGVVYKVDLKQKKLLYNWQGGTAKLSDDGRQLALECGNVEDYFHPDKSGNPRRIEWKTNLPLKRDFSFVGDLIGTENGKRIPGPWGLALYRPYH